MSTPGLYTTPDQVDAGGRQRCEGCGRREQLPDVEVCHDTARDVWCCAACYALAGDPPLLKRITALRDELAQLETMLADDRNAIDPHVSPAEIPF